MSNPADSIRTVYYVDNEGNYLGGYSEGNPMIPDGAIEVVDGPTHALQKYDLDNHVWLPLSV